MDHKYIKAIATQDKVSLNDGGSRMQGVASSLDQEGYKTDCVNLIVIKQDY